MTDLLISRTAPGVARVSSVDPFDTLSIYRVDRARWQHTPECPGVYLLYGANADGKLTVYIGMSTTNMRGRIRSHHVDARKNWFGVLFAVPVGSPLLCPAIEAALIDELTEAGVVDVIANQASERRHRDVDDVHLEPAVDKIREGLQLVLGNDIFTPIDVAEPSRRTDPPLARMAPLAREYRGRVSEPRPRTTADPTEATHCYVGAGAPAWGRFVAEDPDKRFRVLAGSGWRKPILNPEATTYDRQVEVGNAQDGLVAGETLDPAAMIFARDHMFDNWTAATRIVSGKAQYSGAYHWQRLEDSD